MNKDYMRDYMKQRREKRRQKFIDLLGGKCEDCGSKHNLQFDHIDASKKSFDLNDIKDGSEKKITKELKKCQLLCAKCHFKKTIKNKEHVNKTKSPANHGTIWMYKKYKCRCDDCKWAMSKYLKKLNKNKELLSSIAAWVEQIIKKS